MVSYICLKCIFQPSYSNMILILNTSSYCLFEYTFWLLGDRSNCTARERVGWYLQRTRMQRATGSGPGGPQTAPPPTPTGTCLEKTHTHKHTHTYTQHVSMGSWGVTMFEYLLTYIPSVFDLAKYQEGVKKLS